MRVARMNKSLEKHRHHCRKVVQLIKLTNCDQKSGVV
jgi:hypothetical protein